MPGFRPTRVIVHPAVDSVYADLEERAKGGDKISAQLWKSLQTAISRIRLDGQWGEVIPTIPKRFRERFGVKNLYCFDLAGYHRVFYTIFEREVQLLDLVDHAEYDRIFGSRKR